MTLRSCAQLSASCQSTYSCNQLRLSLIAWEVLSYLVMLELLTAFVFLRIAPLFVHYFNLVLAEIALLSHNMFSFFKVIQTGKDLSLSDSYFGFKFFESAQLLVLANLSAKPMFSLYLTSPQQCNCCFISSIPLSVLCSN
jgi:hypothetical protein